MILVDYTYVVMTGGGIIYEKTALKVTFNHPKNGHKNCQVLKKTRDIFLMIFMYVENTSMALIIQKIVEDDLNKHMLKDASFHKVR